MRVTPTTIPLSLAAPPLSRALERPCGRVRRAGRRFAASAAPASSADEVGLLETELHHRRAVEACVAALEACVAALEAVPETRARLALPRRADGGESEGVYSSSSLCRAYP